MGRGDGVKQERKQRENCVLRAVARLKENCVCLAFHVIQLLTTQGLVRVLKNASGFIQFACTN